MSIAYTSNFKGEVLNYIVSMDNELGNVMRNLIMATASRSRQDKISIWFAEPFKGGSAHLQSIAYSKRKVLDMLDIMLPDNWACYVESEDGIKVLLSILSNKSAEYTIYDIDRSVYYIRALIAIKKSKRGL